MTKSWTKPVTLSLGILALVALGLIAFQPAFGAWFVDDDLPLLALARMLDNPLWLLVSNHMFGMPYYRPVGLLFWWLTTALAGGSAFWHYAFSLGLHVAVAVTLWWLTAIMSGRKWLGFGVAALFVVHPLGIVTATWLSDRFDLLAAWFGMLALGAAWRYRQGGRLVALLACLGCLLLALGSKEVAFALVPAIAVIWLWPGGRVLRRAVFWLALPVVLVLTARVLVLGGFAADRLFADRDLIAVLGSGLSSWFGRLPMYMSYWPYFDTAGLAAMVLAMVLVLGAVLLRFMPSWNKDTLGLPPASGRSRVELWCAAAAGTTLVIAAGLVQWPMTGALPVRDVRVSWIDSRYYYLALCGLLTAACALLALVTRASAGMRRRLQIAALALALVLALPPLVLVARDRNAWWREASLESKPLFDAAARAVAEVSLPTPCRIFFLGTDNKDFGALVDVALKARASPGSAIDRCLFQTRHTPWFYITRQAALDATEIAPYQPLRVDGRLFPSSHIGNVSIVYWNLTEDTTPHQLPEALFFAWRDGHFVDVTARVRTGSYPVNFYCNRAAEQCGTPPAKQARSGNTGR